MKLPIFIGSASESKDIAEEIEKKLKQNINYDVTLWSKDFFKQGDITYDKLVSSAISFKYAVLIGGADDDVTRTSNATKYLKPRDNVYFELGLLSGMLSPKRVFFIMSERAKEASDFFGVTLHRYKERASCKTTAEWNQEIQKVVNVIEQGIQLEEKNYRHTLLPSLSLALGYYDNYLKPVCEAFCYGRCSIRVKDNQGKEHEINLQGREKKFYVVVPSDVTIDWKSAASVFYDENAPLKAIIEMSPYEHNPDVNVNERIFRDNEPCEFYNLPLTMNIAFKAVAEVLKQSTTVTTKEKEQAKQLERDAFVGALRTLINNEPIVSRIAIIMEV